MTSRVENHRKLQRSAVRLFAERGYDNVTVDEISRLAGVSHMTFFRHFPTKASVLLDDPYDPIIGQLVKDTDPDLPAMERIRRGLANAWEHVDEPSDGFTRARLRIIVRDEALIARAWENNRKTEAIIVDALIATDVDPLEARIVTGAVMGALMAALIDWGQDEGAEPLKDRVLRALELLADRSRDISHV
jgi:AcrR family transcriptional regulator